MNSELPVTGKNVLRYWHQVPFRIGRWHHGAGDHGREQDVLHVSAAAVVRNFHLPSIETRYIVISLFLYYQSMILTTCDKLTDMFPYECTSFISNESISSAKLTANILYIGLVVMGGDSHSESRGFESRHRILDGNVFTYLLQNFIMFVWKDQKQTKKRPELAHLKNILQIRMMALLWNKGPGKGRFRCTKEYQPFFLGISSFGMKSASNRF